MTQTDADAKSGKEPQRRNNPWNFTKQVAEELRKVRWPTRRELITYTIVVLVFVVLVLSYVSLADFVFAELITWLYSGFSPEGEFRGLGLWTSIATGVMAVLIGAGAFMRSRGD